MERPTLMLRWLAIVLALVTVWPDRSAVAEGSGRVLVVVAGEASPLEAISPEELRRVYLLLPVEVGGIRPVPLRNESDEFLSQVFLQRVIFMSERGYERQLVSRVFRFGGVRPPVFEKLSNLVAALRENRAAVSVMWRSEVKANGGLKIIGVLWEESSP